MAVRSVVSRPRTVPSPGGATSAREHVEALASVALSVSASEQVDAVLAQVVRTSRELLDADRATILLLDDDVRGLYPAVSVARAADETLWSRFRSMPPISLDLTPAGVEFMAAGRAICLPDVAGSALVPPAWRQAFGLVSLALAPLRAYGEPCGVLVVDHAAPRVFRGDELRTLEGIAASTAMAVRAARNELAISRRTARLEEILAIPAELNAAPGLHRVLQAASDGLCAVFDADSCSLNVLDDVGGFTTLASRGAGQPAPGRYLLAALDAGQQGEVRRRWAVDPTTPVVVPPGHRPPRSGAFEAVDAAAYGVVVPFVTEQRVRGFAVLGRAAGEVTAEQLRVGMSIAAQVWLAIDRARLAADVERRLRQLEVLRSLSDDVTLTPDMQLVLERIAPLVHEETGGELIDALLCDPHAARRFATSVPRGELAGLIRRWRQQPAPAPEQVGGLLAVPLLLDGELLGVLRIRARRDAAPPGEPTQRTLLAIGAGVAEVIGRAVLRSRVADSGRDVAVAEERRRVAGELHTSVGRLLATAHARLGPAARTTTDPTARAALAESLALVGQARERIRDAAQALASVPAPPRGLAVVLRDLGRALATSTGIDVDVRVVGRPAPLTAAAESVLLRAAQEALTRLTRHAHASVVLVRLRYGVEAVDLSVRDNGVGLGQRQAAEPALHAAIRHLGERLDGVGGACELTCADGRGLRLLARVPAGPPGSGRGFAPVGEGKARAGAVPVRSGTARVVRPQVAR